MTKKRPPQDYSAAEFDAVVELIRGDADLQKDIETITGQTLDGKSPRELFDLFRTLQRTTEVQAAVVNYGRARRAVRQAAAEAVEPVEVPDVTARYVADMQAKLDAKKRENDDLRTALKLAQAPRPVLQLTTADATSRKAVGQ
ncbi:hypothetical protein [Streptosporangium sp. G12]